MPGPNSLLVDTHVFLWWRMNDPRLKQPAKDAMASSEAVFVSAASVWEATIKIALGRLELPESFTRGVEESGFTPLPILFSHAEAAGALPLHHRDPFDRMLVAQAREERLTLVTHDRKLEQYGVQTLWV